MALEISSKLSKYLNDKKIEEESNNKNSLIKQINQANKSSSSIEEEDEEKSKGKNMEIIDKILVNNGLENSEFDRSILSFYKN